MKKTTLIVIPIIWVFASAAYSAVPPTRIHLPDVPFFLRSMEFRSLQMAVFPAAVSGMIEDPYSDLSWNPAFVLRPARPSAYLSFQDRPEASGRDAAAASDYRNYSYYSADDNIRASWVSSSSISSMDTDPLYHLAAVVPLSPRFSLSVMNRALIDYGPFRSLGSYDWRDSSYGDAMGSKNEPKRLSLDNDRQNLIGTQTQVSLGYRLSNKFDLGLRWGLLTCDRDGNLDDSDRGTYPHSSFSHVQSEALGIDGRHLEAGLGLIWRLDEATRLGVYAGATWGKSEESLNMSDRNSDWYENDVQPAYYREYSNALTGAETHPAKGLRPVLALTFERDFSDTLRFRSFFAYSRSEYDLEGAADAAYASASDYTYDYYDAAIIQYRFRRAESGNRSSQAYQGTGTETWDEFKGFVSLAYAPGKRWRIFGGLHLQRGLFDRTVSETTVFNLDSETTYSLYRPESDRFHHSYDKTYGRKTEESQWVFVLPLGMKFEIAKGLFAVLGTDLTVSLSERHDRGDVQYHSKITRRWENGRLIVNDEEFNRAEVFIADSPKTLQRRLGSRLGIVYEYNSSLTFYLRVEDNIAQTSNWAFGFEIKL